MLELSIDRENKTLHAVVELVGEDQPIALDVRYEIKFDETMEEAKFTATTISISREWMDLVAQEFVGQEFVIKGQDSTRWIKLVKDIGLV